MHRSVALASHALIWGWDLVIRGEIGVDVDRLAVSTGHQTLTAHDRRLHRPALVAQLWTPQMEVRAYHQPPRWGAEVD